MMVLIDKKKLLADLNGVKDVLVAQGDPFLANILHRAIQCVENQRVVMVTDSVKEGQHELPVSDI